MMKTGITDPRQWHIEFHKWHDELELKLLNILAKVVDLEMKISAANKMNEQLHERIIACESRTNKATENLKIALEKFNAKH
jgi:hypothetical protein